jgi:6-phosphogluconate dehydrogenase
MFKNMKIAYIGLGKMGKNMVLRLLEQGIEVVAWNRSPEPLAEVKSHGALGANDFDDLVRQLDLPRVIWLMLPAGGVTDDILDKLIPKLSRGDLVVDGANSFYKDSQRRAQKLQAAGIRFLDVGVSGGPVGAREGACLMIGGEHKDYIELEDLFRAAAAANSYKYLGLVGAGHFAKMVHNGIEYGMMEAIAEGTTVLADAEFEYDLAQVMELYNRGSVIESRLVGWTKEALAEDPTLAGTTSVISHTGEGEWTVQVANELEVPVPVIDDALQVRMDSANADPESPAGFRNKVVSAMRGKFGGHSIKK